MAESDSNPAATARAKRLASAACLARQATQAADHPPDHLDRPLRLYLLPFYWMLVSALKPIEELRHLPADLYPHDFRWANFQEATEVFPFWQFLKNTSIITALTVIGVALTNPIVAYGFSRIQWPGRDKIFMVVLATVFIPFPR